MTDTTAPVYPPDWASLVDIWTRRLTDEGHRQPDVQARVIVDTHYLTEAYETNARIGDWHYSVADHAACGLHVAYKRTQQISMVNCPDCCREVDRMLVQGGDLAQVNPTQARDAARRFAERYMVDVLGIPGYATPTGTKGTPLFAFACEVRSLVIRRHRLLARHGVALDTVRGQLHRVRSLVADGVTPSAMHTGADEAFEAFAGLEAVRTLDNVIKQLAAVLVLTCTQVDRWLKAEAPGVTGEPQGVEGVLAAVSDWRELRGLPVPSRVVADANERLACAVDAWRATVAPVADV